jgi:hypothetical protein
MFSQQRTSPATFGRAEQHRSPTALACREQVRQARVEVHPAQLVSALEEVATRLGIEVRYDSVDRNHPLGVAGGGLCRLRGKAMILLDERLTSRDRASVLAKALSRFDLDAIFLAPAVRNAIEAHGAGPTPRPPLARTKGPR